MKKKILALLLVSLLLSSCQMRFGSRLFGGNRRRNSFATPTATVIEIPTDAPTATPAPPPTVTPTPPPDLTLLGLPAESAGSRVLDFAADVCKAVWSNSNGEAPCEASDLAASTGYAAMESGDIPDWPKDLSALLVYPPQDNGDTLTGTYPAFTVEKGDRFRAVLACRAHAFCDVEFGLEYSTDAGRGSLAHWSYLFADAPKIVDYSLDGIAGKTVQFRLMVRRHGVGQQDYAVWILPHIYRPAP